MEIYIYIWKCHDKAPCVAILNKQKCHFFKKKSENKKVKQLLSGEDGTSRREEEVGKGYGMVNIAQILYTHVCKWKNDTC
jgi:hypothetical protein